MRGAMALVTVLPRRLALGAGAALARAALAAGLRRSVTDGNLAVAFPELAPADRARLLRGVYEHFGRMAVDSLRLSARGPTALVPHVTHGDLVRLLEPAVAAGRGAIVLTGHVGNWELAGAYLAARGFPLVAVVKPPSNPYLARHTERVRLRLGIESVALPDARTAIPAALRANRVVALVADQGTLRSAAWTSFFGRPTRTAVGPGLFHRATGAPIYFGAMVAQEDSSYRLVGELLAERVDGELQEVVQTVADAYRGRLEALVRQVPSQYLWTHRLWKHQPGPVAP